MQPVADHPWQVTPEVAREIQEAMRSRIRLIDEPVGPVDVLGIDCGYVRRPDGWMAYAAAVRFAMPPEEPLETWFGSAAMTFPYVPGLLTFREGPAIVAALAQIERPPDLLMIDGHGIAHPRRLGIATHIGVLYDLPSIGCAKSTLTGRYPHPGPAHGDWTPITDRGEMIGAAVRTRMGQAPLLVSPGHRISVERAVAVVLQCCRDDGYLPVPTQAAHVAVAAYTKPLRGQRS